MPRWPEFETIGDMYAVGESEVLDLASRCTAPRCSLVAEAGALHRRRQANLI